MLVTNTLERSEQLFWDKKCWREAPNDYPRLHLYHWLHLLNTSTMSCYLLKAEAPFAMLHLVWLPRPKLLANVVGTS